MQEVAGAGHPLHAQPAGEVAVVDGVVEQARAHAAVLFADQHLGGHRDVHAQPLLGLTLLLAPQADQMPVPAQRGGQHARLAQGMLGVLQVEARLPVRRPALPEFVDAGKIILLQPGFRRHGQLEELHVAAQFDLLGHFQQRLGQALERRNRQRGEGAEGVRVAGAGQVAHGGAPVVADQMHAPAQLIGEHQQVVHRGVQGIVAVAGLTGRRVAAQGRREAGVARVGDQLHLHRPVFMGIGKTVQ